MLPFQFQTGRPVYSGPKERAPLTRKPRPKQEKPIKTPTSFREATKMGLEDAGLGLKQTAQGALSMTVLGSAQSNLEKERQATESKRDKLNEARDRYQGGDGVTGFLKEAAVRLPGNIIKTVPELLNPSKKIKALNALYHGGRAYARTKDPVKSVTAAAANVVGEKAESLMGNLPGNAVGSVIEKLGGKAIEEVGSNLAESTASIIATAGTPKKTQ
jgi:hypothetical protein